jgi:predicted nuclease of restriction endonuclease-like (RecB) superfamily
MSELELPVAATAEAIREILAGARVEAHRAVNSVMVQAYWQVGRVLVEQEQAGEERAEYGARLVRQVAERLTAEFGKGYDHRNLWYMRSFYLAFPKVNAVRSLLTWTHYRLLLKVERPEARQFYLDECIASNWSTRQLDRQIASQYYHRLLASRDRDPVRAEIASLEPGPTPLDFIKDPYVLEFLGGREQPVWLEKDLEKGLIDKLQDFLLELGKGFSFVARQRRLSVDGEHFYVDLVFYNFLLKCFVLIDLKAGKLTHGDIGQMDFYVRYFEKEVRQADDNPTIGLILCAEKNEAMARYTLLEENLSIFASKYQLYLPTEDELRAELERERLWLESGKPNEAAAAKGEAR